MAKAALAPSPEIGDSPQWREEIGRAIDRARQLRGWNLDEFADAVKRDSRQVARWFTGVERPQLDAVFAVESLRQPLVIALAELVASDSIRIETVIRVTRRMA
jgi:transcriptional regulator with XRE-family HTH domain